MVGDGPQRPLARQRAEEEGVADRVLFLGAHHSVHELLRCADVFLLPSENESFGLAALEAMACGTPVVASDRGGIPEVVPNGEAGYLLPLGDVEGMADRTLAILDSCGQLILVTTPQVTALRNTHRFLEVLDLLGYDRDGVVLVLNHCYHHSNVRQQDVERALGHPVAQILDHDPAAVTNSLNLGKPLVEENPNSAVARGIQKLARLLEVLRTDPNRTVCDIALLALNTAARLSELLKLRWADCDLERRVITIRAANSKNKRSRKVPINPAAMEVLQSQWSRGLHEHVFKRGEQADLLNDLVVALQDRSVEIEAQVETFAVVDLDSALDDVRAEGRAALLSYGRRFDDLGPGGRLVYEREDLEAILSDRNEISDTVLVLQVLNHTQCIMRTVRPDHRTQNRFVTEDAMEWTSSGCLHNAKAIQ